MCWTDNGTVYLIHFNEKLCHAQHYIGYTTNLNKRIKKHSNGSGSKLINAINELGLDWEVVRIWENVPQSFERELKNYKNSPALCPVCSGSAALNRKQGKD